MGGYMKTIKTLGPKTTDSYRAAIMWCQKRFKSEIYTIELSDCMEDAFLNMNSGEFIVMPMGYSNREDQEYFSWVDIHFRNLGLVNIADVFLMHTKEMIVVENLEYKINKGVIQSSTYQLLKGCISNIDDIDYAPSKSRALSKMLEDDYRYVVCSKDEFENRVGTLNNKYIIKSIIEPTMVWIVYEVC